MAPTTPIRPATPKSPRPPVPKAPAKFHRVTSPALTCLLQLYSGNPSLSVHGIEELLRADLVRRENLGPRPPSPVYVLSPRGLAHVRQILALPLPVEKTQWFGADGKLIPMFDEESEDD